MMGGDQKVSWPFFCLLGIIPVSDGGASEDGLRSGAGVEV